MLRKSLLLAIVAMISLGTAQPVSAAYLSSTDTWDTYSRMFSRSAGQFYAGHEVGGQWAWSPQSATVSDIAWGDPRSWPPNYAERFVRSGDWVLVEGYSDGPGRPLTQVQRVTSEKIGDVKCQNMKPLPSDGGRQHYVKWEMPRQGYCLDAIGTIKSPTYGTTVNFRHRQSWSPPVKCSNAYVRNQICIIQREEWWDDNGGPYALRLSRTQYIAKGQGMAFKIVQDYPSQWSADGRYTWNW